MGEPSSSAWPDRSSLDDARVLLRALVDLEDLFEDDAVLGEGLVDLPLALLDALGRCPPPASW